MRIPGTADTESTATDDPLSGVALSVSPSVSRLNNPIALAAARDGRGRLFVAERAGVRTCEVRRVYKKPYRTSPRWSVPTVANKDYSGWPFPQSSKTNGISFVTYSARDGAVIRIARRPKSSKNSVKKSTLKTILRVPHLFATNHNGGSLAFGTDGLLYFGTGLTGEAGETAADGAATVESLGRFFGSDVSKSCGRSGTAFPCESVPHVNQDQAARVRVWWCETRGVSVSIQRLAHRWVADVGQDAYEEVNVVSSTGARGVNFGWSCKGQCRIQQFRQCAGLAGYVALVTTLCHTEAVSGLHATVRW